MTCREKVFTRGKVTRNYSIPTSCVHGCKTGGGGPYLDAGWPGRVRAVTRTNICGSFKGGKRAAGCLISRITAHEIFNAF